MDYGLIIIIILWILGALILYCLAPCFYLEHGINGEVLALPTSEPVVPSEDTVVEMVQAPAVSDSAPPQPAAPPPGPAEDTPLSEACPDSPRSRRVAADVARLWAVGRLGWSRWKDRLCLLRQQRGRAQEPTATAAVAPPPSPAIDMADFSVLEAGTAVARPVRRLNWPRWADRLCLPRPRRGRTPPAVAMFSPSCPPAEPDVPYFFAAAPACSDAWLLQLASERDPLAPQPPYNPHVLV